MSTGCQLIGCTVSQTGACALENDVATCPNRLPINVIPALATTPVLASAQPAAATSAESDLGTPVLDAPPEKPSFPPSRALGLKAVGELMANRYCTIVGILGDPESGKTACLVSLYLLVSHVKLSGWTYADSRSLMAFEEISRGARRWQDGQPPDQMTVHTELSDDRRPGFLHLRLRRDMDAGLVDLFLPDLPGEWTKDLIKSANVSRFDFMKSSDVIWLVSDGRALIKREGRQGAIHRINLLVGRVAKMFAGHPPRLILVLTHRDSGAVSEVTLKQIRDEAMKLDVVLEVISVASFSSADGDGEVLAGHGLVELINATTSVTSMEFPFRRSAPVKHGARAFLSYRRHE